MTVAHHLPQKSSCASLRAAERTFFIAPIARNEKMRTFASQFRKRFSVSADLRNVADLAQLVRACDS